MAAKAFDPKGKAFKQRLKAFLDDAKATHKVTVGQDNGRTKEWSQKHHVAHMYLYNKYKFANPANRDSGKKTISWSHLSDPKVKWDTIKASDFLRTKKNTAPVKDGTKWKTGHEPDETTTKKQVKLLQTNAGIGKSGTAMVAPGLRPCGEPCKCGAKRSKHLSGLAADLDMPKLKSLTTKLKTAKAGSLDDYLKKFGLHRPLLNHAISKEPWHVESI